MSLLQIGELAGKHPSTVGYWLQKHGLTANGAEKYAPRGGLRRDALEASVDRKLTLGEMAGALTEVFRRFVTGCVSSACDRPVEDGGARRRPGQGSLSSSADAMGGQSSFSRDAAITAASTVAGMPSRGGDGLSSGCWSKRPEALVWSAATPVGWAHCSFTTSTPGRRSSTLPNEAIRVRSPGAGQRFGNAYCSAPTATPRSRAGSLLCRWISSRRPDDRLGRGLLSPS